MTNTRSQDSTATSTYWWLGLATGAAVSAIITGIVITWEWVQNPGGIFHSEAETNWEFVFDTAISWFVPTFVFVAIIASVLHFAWKVVRNHRRKER